jgi:hypothetical protein
MPSAFARACVWPSIHGLTSRERGHVRLRRLGRAQGGLLIWRLCANHWRGIANLAQALQRLKGSHLGFQGNRVKQSRGY